MDIRATAGMFERRLSFRVIWWDQPTTTKYGTFTFDFSVFCAIGHCYLCKASETRHSDFNHISPHTGFGWERQRTPFIYDFQNRICLPPNVQRGEKIRNTRNESYKFSIGNFPTSRFISCDCPNGIAVVMPAIGIVAIFPCLSCFGRLSIRRHSTY